MQSNPTVVVGHLSDEEIKASIESIVTSVDDGAKRMAQKFDAQILEMEKSFKRLQNLKDGFGDIGGSTKGSGTSKTKQQTQELKEQERAVKETTQSYDQMAAAAQKAIRYPSEMRMPEMAQSSRDSYLAFMHGFKNQATQLQQQIENWENLLLARQIQRIKEIDQQIERINQKIKEVEHTPSPNRKQVIDDYKRQIEVLRELQQHLNNNPFSGQDTSYIDKYRAERERVLNIMKEEATAEKDSTSATSQMLAEQSKVTAEFQKQINLIQSRKDATHVFEKVVALPADTYEQAQTKLQVLQALKEKVANTPLFSKNQTQTIGNEIDKVKVKMSFLYKTTEEGAKAERQRAEEMKRSTQRRLEEIEKEKAALKEKGLVAQQSANAVRQAMRDQLQDNMASNVQTAISGLKDLQRHISDMQKGYASMSGVEQASPIGLSLKEDIRLAREAMVAVSKYNLYAVTKMRSPMESLEKYDSYKLLSDRVNRLTKEYKNMTSAERESEKGRGLIDKLQLFNRALREIQVRMNTPISLEKALGNPENTLDRISYKIQQLNAYRMRLDITDPKQVSEMRTVEVEIDRLKKKQDELMGNNHKVITSNNALTRSWNYMKNRLAFYFTVGASTQFVKELIEVRSQYEMNERALGVLIDSAERGTEVFNELSQMALVSPYTLIELSNAARQLTAYDVAAKDVVDTTRRMADISAAVGIPMERLTYALGQIKAYGYLNSRDARMFLNAGIPLVKALSEHYTELEGRMVSVGDVYDRIKKKAVDYNEVMQVITEMTDEGGRFFDFQAKMAETLKVQLANLTLAWNNMLNDIGKSEQGILTGGIKTLKEFFLNWKSIEKVLLDVVVVLGFAKASQLLLNAAFGKGTMLAIKEQVAQKTLTASYVKNILAKQNLTKAQAKWLVAANKGNIAIEAGVVKLGVLTTEEAAAAAATSKLGMVWKAFAMTISTATQAIETAMAALSAIAPQLILFAAISAIVDVIQTVMDRNAALEEFNKTLVRNAEEHAKAIREILDSYSSGFDATTLPIDEQKKHWDSLRESIELNSAAANNFIQVLLQEDDMGQRVNMAKALLEKIEQAHELMSLWGEDALDITQDFKVLGVGADGLAEDAKDFGVAMSKAGGAVENLAEASEGIKGTWATILSYVHDFTQMQTWGGYNPTKYINPLYYFDQKLFDESDHNKNKLISTYKELVDEVEPLAESLMKKITDDQISDEKEIKEVISQTIKDLAEEKGWSDQVALSARILLEQKFRESSNKIFQLSVEDRQASWDMWMKYLMARHKTVFQNMGNEEISTEQWAQDSRKKLYKKTFEDFKKVNILAYNDIKDKVDDLNQMQVHIKVFYDEQNQPSWLEQDFKKRLPNSTLNVSAYDNISELIDGERKALKESNEELQNLINAGVNAASGGEAGKHYLDVKMRADQATEALKAYNASLEKETKGNKGSKKDVLGDALTKEIQLISDIQKRFVEYKKMGVDAQTAITLATDEYGKSMQRNNAVLQKYGIKAIATKELTTMPLQQIRDYYQEQLELAERLGNTKGVEALEKAIAGLNVEISKLDYKKIVDGLNSELGKLKEDYELAIELDANPELGDMFSNLFGIDTTQLPHTFQEAYEKANDYAKKYLKDLKVDFEDFDLLSTRIMPDDKNLWRGLDIESQKDLIKFQQTWREMLKKNMTETEKNLDEYVKKYGDLSDKIAEIEAKRIENVKRLNDAYYTEDSRRSQEYLSKLNAINASAARERGAAKLDEFKNSDLYISMFENLRYASTATLNAIRTKLEDLKSELGTLNPEQLKQITKQFEKIDQELLRRNPFKGLIKNIREYTKAVGQSGKAAQKQFTDAQKKYDAQLELVSGLKEEIKQREAENITDNKHLVFLKDILESEEQKLAKLKEELRIASELNEKHDLMRQIFNEQASAIAKTVQVIASNLSGLAELRDTLDAVGINLGDDLDAIIDDLDKVGQGLNQITSSATSGNVVGVVSGVVKTVTGIGDSIASVFGDGSAKTKRLNREIARSQYAVKELQKAYEQLERAVDKSTGTQETWAKRQQIANKEEQMAELQRQMQLEQGKRSKDRDGGVIEQYKEQIDALYYEIQDLKEGVVSDLLGSDVKTAAQEFVDTWVQAWKQGETTLEAVTQKMDEMIMELIKRAASSAIVERLLKPLYNEVDKITQEGSESGVKITMNEMKALADLSVQVGADINEALGAFYGSLENLGVVSKDADGEKTLSALQQGIQGITEDTAGAIEAYMNGVSQQVYLHSDLLTQIRDAVVAIDSDAQLGVQAQMLLQLQQSYAIQVAIQGILNGWSTPSGLAVRVEMV